MQSDEITEQLLYKILDRVYPVGSQYTNLSDDRSPSVILGFGEWEAIAGRVVVGLDSSQTEFNVVGKVGGAKTHTLSIAEMPSHAHTMPGILRQQGTGSNIRTLTTGTPDSPQDTANTGGGGAHNNLQPYVVACIWKRVG